MLKIRPLTVNDQDQLWDWLHIALWDPPPAGLRPRSVLQTQRVRIYAEKWGRAGDTGVVGELAGNPLAIGACWLRCMPTGVGLAYVDDETPQLGIGLLPAYQRKGYGSQLLGASLDAAVSAGFRQVSLTVHPQNPAVVLYERSGFEKVAVRNEYYLMLRQL